MVVVVLSFGRFLLCVLVLLLLLLLIRLLLLVLGRLLRSHRGWDLTIIYSSLLGTIIN